MKPKLPIRAYLCEYQVTVLAYGRTAAEAAENGYGLFTLGDTDAEANAVENFPDADYYAGMVARYRQGRSVGRPKRSPADDLDPAMFDPKKEDE